MAYEYAGKDPLNDDDKEEGPNVESNANATKFLMTGVSRNSDEPVNEGGVSRDSDEPVNEIADPNSTMNALELSAHTVRVVHENGKLTDKQ